nr:ribonuclease H-like domain-containing protein [Tanacetum cinerariifolium]
GNPQYALKDKRVIDSGCSQHMIGNMSYLSDFEELNGGYVVFGGNPKGGKISGKGKIKTEWVLVTKPYNKTPYELLHGRTPSLGFMRPFGCPVTILNTLDSLGKFKGKEHDFDSKKLESEVIFSPSSSAQSRKQDDKTKKEAKGKSHVESFTRYRDLSAEFEDCTENSKLEDITNSDNENDVGVEADFNNLETSITVSPIPTSRIHKDHHVSQIIGDLSTQTRSMTIVVKDQGGLSQMFNDDFHTCLFACFLLQEEPKRV